MTSTNKATPTSHPSGKHAAGPDPTRRAVLAGTGGALALAPGAMAAGAMPVTAPAAVASEPLNAFAARLAARVDLDVLSGRSWRWLGHRSRAFAELAGHLCRSATGDVLVHPSLADALPRAAEVERDPLALYVYSMTPGVDPPPLPDDPDLLVLVALHEVVDVATAVLEAYAKRGALDLGVSERPTRDPALRAVRVPFRFRIAPSRAIDLVHVLPHDRSRLGREGLVTHLGAPSAAIAGVPEEDATWMVPA